MLTKQFIAGYLLLVLVNTISAEYDVDGVCTLIKDGGLIGSIESCQKYYSCNKGKATAYVCPDGTRFSKNLEKCVSESSVDCYIGAAGVCTGRSAAFISKPGTCNGWIYCKNEKQVGSGSCGSNLIFQNGECRYGECTVDSSNLNTNFTSICQVMPNNKYFGSTKECSKWQICRNEKLVGGFCKNGLVYNVNLASCTYASSSSCSQVSGITVQPDAEVYGSCNNVNTKKPSNICSDYLKCENNLWKRYSCNRGYYFDITTSSCVARISAITTDCDRCLFSTKEFVNAVDEECRKYLVCQNGIKKTFNYCATGYYFDEIAGGCVKSTDTVSKASNGACQAATSSDTSSSADSDSSDTSSSADSDSSDTSSSDNSDSSTDESASDDTSEK
ncbi:unnamed protein product [Ceratitis capitata]|uniref:(Mediterranean fruit fly) hypothetical protein n=1 Tax=Ceratitis capitata TaxID=7213 RepID=A0A811V5M4_CERCA|nr:unnamed protein product [Ceratitis capitata]